MYIRKIEEDQDCGLYLAMKVLGGKWKCCILDAINKGITRPSEIARSVQEASTRVIEMQLAELLAYGVVDKYAEEDVFPKKSEYRLTGLGESLLPILSQIDQWGMQNAQLIKEKSTELQGAE
ncbi:helix-turn-helix transcriptional regulator [Pseudoflavitalea sp. G-6-1-2]|uniref:winged helix-turn-helix transcriptional regulator n=1 Tax=Pseudoflavitalea sp. G-6-1-2 TaxID=2728841 RepID=UPI00146A7B48|nr:helix-turn-helix domain-containing protein [Pseudoflavitalea sp. G-6-1-2]NML22007.1 helix-turn-helix transcriptional regulator [Pseudoflavitalea sp. G-6-1-2]